MTIQEVADQTGISAYTIRFYEKSGVLPPVKRTEGGMRQFTAVQQKMEFYERYLRDQSVSNAEL